MHLLDPMFPDGKPNLTILTILLILLFLISFQTFPTTVEESYPTGSAL